MAVNEPIDPGVCLAISQWPEDAPRGAVSTFCAEHGISRKSFYELRRRAKEEGPAAVLEPRSRRPVSSPSRLSEEIRDQAIAVRAALEASGLDHGPVSVHDKMRAVGLPRVPSTASLARVFREAGVARREPRKKPRSAWRRFVYPAPNACWQLDATEYVLTGGQRCVVFQLIDDHSRYAVASHVAWAETAKAAIEVFDKAVAAHGVPQRLLSDNGLAFNPSRRGHVGQLVAHLAALGVEAITGKPYKPTTQGKNERFHQTLFRYLDSNPSPRTWPSCKARSTPSTTSTTPPGPTRLPGHITPMAAWEATPKADPPRPRPDRPVYVRPAPRFRRATPPPDLDLPADTVFKKLHNKGTFTLDSVHYRVGQQHGFEPVLVITEGNQPGDKITVTDLDGEILIEHTRPDPGTTYVGNGRPPGSPPTDPGPSPKS